MTRRTPRLIRPCPPVPATAPPPLTGVWAPVDTRLDAVEQFALPHGGGPEDVVVDSAGRLVAGGVDGALWRWSADPDPSQPPTLLADTGGRPLGIEVDPRDGSLVVCDAIRGLLRVTDDGTVTPLCHRAARRRLVFCNNAAVCRDGTVLFTDSSDRYGVDNWKRDLLEHRPNGRLLAWQPGAAEAEVLTHGLHFPNGVALTPEEDAVLLVETTTHRLVRIPLDSGVPTDLLDLPVYPDNMAAVGDGTYWIALPSPRVRIAERLLPYPRVRRLASLLPDALLPGPIPYGMVALVDGAGQVLRTLHGPSGSYRMITGVRQHGDVLWLGSLTENAVARVGLC
jgi:sugar lactone lactonase YvrE